jgi:hypothetical protein
MSIRRKLFVGVLAALLVLSISVVTSSVLAMRNLGDQVLQDIENSVGDMEMDVSKAEVSIKPAAKAGTRNMAASIQGHAAYVGFGRVGLSGLSSARPRQILSAKKWFEDKYEVTVTDYQVDKQQSAGTGSKVDDRIYGVFLLFEGTIPKSSCEFQLPKHYSVVDNTAYIPIGKTGLAKVNSQQILGSVCAFEKKYKVVVKDYDVDRTQSTGYGSGVGDYVHGVWLRFEKAEEK